MLKNYLWYFLFGCLSLFMAGCSNDNEPSMPSNVYDIDDDLLGGKVFFYINLSDPTEGDYYLETSEPVDFYIYDDVEIKLSVIDSEEGQCLVPIIPNGYDGGRSVFKGYAVGRESGEIRNVVFIVTSDINDENADGKDWTEESPLFSTYGSILGQSTNCYDEIGKTVRPILLFNHLDLADRNLFFGRDNNMTEKLDEIHEHSFESMMKTWSGKLGISGGMNGFSGGFACGFTSSKRESKDYEYLMCYYMVERAEMKMLMDEFSKRTVRDAMSAANVLGYFVKLFHEDIIETCNERFDPKYFYDKWGTDLITQGTLGGYYSLIYSREENVYEHSIAMDFSLYAKHNDKIKKDASVLKWYEKFKEADKEGFFKGSASLSYQKEEYFSASKAKKQIYFKGGTANVDDPEEWVKSFKGRDDCNSWALINYRVGGDSIAPTGTSFLYSLDKLADNLIDALETTFKSSGKMSESDDQIITNARRNVEKLRNYREKYLKEKAITEKDETPLVLCDVMMKKNPKRRANGEPAPFVEEDPRKKGVYRTYYPILANRFFDIGHVAQKKMRGLPIDTNDDVFLASGHTSSHYWYYAMAHKDDTDGILDIKFLTDKEVHDNPDYFYYKPRGSHARHGLSGLLVKKRYVYVLFGDGDKKNSDKLITAFGLYDDHKDYKAYEDNTAWHIFASTRGADLDMNALDKETNAYKSFWNDPFKGGNVVKGEKPFYEGGGVMPHSFYPIYTTKPLPTSDYEELNKYKLTTW